MKNNFTDLIINCPDTLQFIMYSDASLLNTIKLRPYNCFDIEGNENDENYEDLIGVIFDSFNYIGD